MTPTLASRSKYVPLPSFLQRLDLLCVSLQMSVLVIRPCVLAHPHRRCKSWSFKHTISSNPYCVHKMPENFYILPILPSTSLLNLKIRSLADIPKPPSNPLMKKPNPPTYHYLEDAVRLSQKSADTIDPFAPASDDYEENIRDITDRKSFELLISIFTFVCFSLPSCIFSGIGMCIAMSKGFVETFDPYMVGALLLAIWLSPFSSPQVEIEPEGMTCDGLSCLLLTFPAVRPVNLETF